MKRLKLGTRVLFIRQGDIIGTYSRGTIKEYNNNSYVIQSEPSGYYQSVPRSLSRIFISIKEYLKYMEPIFAKTTKWLMRDDKGDNHHIYPEMNKLEGE